MARRAGTTSCSRRTRLMISRVQSEGAREGRKEERWNVERETGWKGDSWNGVFIFRFVWYELCRFHGHYRSSSRRFVLQSEEPFNSNLGTVRRAMEDMWSTSYRPAASRYQAEDAIITTFLLGSRALPIDLPACCRNPIFVL